MSMTNWLAGRYGRKTVYQFSLAVFALGLILDTLATTSIQFVLARIVQGAASGPLAPLSLAILLDVLPPARHARISLAVTVCSCSASAADRASAAGSVNITAGARSSISACQ